MLDQTIHCIVRSPDGARPVHVVRPDGLAGFLDGLPDAQAAFLRGARFAAKANETALLPGPGGVEGAVLGIGTDASPFAFGGLHASLPPDTPWHLQPGDYDPASATLGFCLGASRRTARRCTCRPSTTPACPRRRRPGWCAS